SHAVQITTNDFEIVDYLNQFAACNDLNINDVSSDNRCSTYSLTTDYGKKNPLLDQLRSLNLIQNKHIPDIYKFSSEEQRLALLAGLMDSDGYTKGGTCIQFTLKIKALSDDIAEVFNSLSIHAYTIPVKKSIKSIGFTGNYFTTYISGFALDRI